MKAFINHIIGYLIFRITNFRSVNKALISLLSHMTYCVAFPLSYYCDPDQMEARENENLELRNLQTKETLAQDLQNHN